MISLFADDTQFIQNKSNQLKVDISKIKWKLYRSEEYKFEVLYPENWVVFDGTLDTTFLSQQPTNPSSKPKDKPIFLISFNHNTFYESKMKPAETVLESKCNHPQKNEEPFIQGKIELAGVQAYMKYCRRYGQRYSRVEVLFDILKEKNFVIGAEERPEENAPKVRGINNKDFKNWYYYPVYKKMIESFKYFGEAPERI